MIIKYKENNSMAKEIVVNTSKEILKYFDQNNVLEIVQRNA